MKTDFKHLTRALKTVLIVLLLSVAGTTKGNAEETDPYLLYMLFNDYQVCEQLVPQREWNGIDDIRCMQLPRDESGMQASWYYLNTAPSSLKRRSSAFKAAELIMNKRMASAPVRSIRSFGSG